MTWQIVEWVEKESGRVAKVLNRLRLSLKDKVKIMINKVDKDKEK